MRARNLKVGQLLYGISTFIPGVAAVFGRGGGDTQSARYCYSVWLRHLVTAFASGMKTHPRVVAELGPGDSLGVGLAALVSGAERYHAFDVVRHAQVKRNQAVLAELIELFRNRADIPGETEFPEVQPLLPSYAFPRHVLGEEQLAAALGADRLARIADSVTNQNAAGSMIDYRTRWFDDQAIERASIDLLFSQAVLEHVDDLPGSYRAMRLWIKPDGMISHQIDFRCHNTAGVWNGHWRYADLTWRLIRGRRSYLLNREPYSTHLRLLAENGFTFAGGATVRSDSLIERGELASRFRHLTEQDLITSSALIQAVPHPAGAAA
ncbi:MAG TPA: methyltransferase domain-containing protein [Polyangia bacterium]|nr:methyltransferase domain-containing protein [Polyangia bacterium]